MDASMLRLPSRVAHADWGVNAKKRRMVLATSRIVCSRAGIWSQPVTSSTARVRCSSTRLEKACTALPWILAWVSSCSHTLTLWCRLPRLILASTWDIASIGARGVQRYSDYLQGRGRQNKAFSLRYVGSLVADFHRNLLAGGVFYYPADSQDPKKPHGKLRLLYEAAPLAFLAEQAGGCASDGVQNILDIVPDSLHQRTPLFIGNRDLVESAEQFIRQFDAVK
jgi:hypothetical protein